jgi:hypothetical protein
MSSEAEVRPFRIDFPEAELTELRRRVNATRWPERETVTDDSQGVRLAMMQELARYWGSDYDGIRVNAVSPGVIQTPLHQADSYEALGGRLPPLGRPGQVSDVVDGVLFLESSPYITGEILHIDGGQTAWY